MTFANGATLVTALLVVVLVGTTAVAAVTERPAVQADGGPTRVDGCTAITEPGRYVLSADVENGDRGENFTFISQSCIRIRSSDVVLDGNGHVVDGFGVSDTTAIRVGGDGPVSNVTVGNLTTGEWNRGIYVENASNATVENADVSGNALGVFVEDATGVTVRNVTAGNNFVGIYSENVSGTFVNNALQDGQPIVVDRQTSAATPSDANGTTTATAGNATTTPLPRSPVPTLATPDAPPRRTTDRPTSP